MYVYQPLKQSANVNLKDIISVYQPLIRYVTCRHSLAKYVHKHMSVAILWLVRLLPYVYDHAEVFGQFNLSEK